MTLAGIAVLDIAQHYIERWNEVKKRKVASISHLTFVILMILATVPPLIVRARATVM
jgi:phospholipase D1/2